MTPTAAMTRKVLCRFKWRELDRLHFCFGWEGHGHFHVCRCMAKHPVAAEVAALLRASAGDEA